MLLDGYKYHKLKIFLLLSALELKIAMLISIDNQTQNLQIMQEGDQLFSLILLT